MTREGIQYCVCDGIYIYILNCNLSSPHWSTSNSYSNVNKSVCFSSYKRFNVIHKECFSELKNMCLKMTKPSFEYFLCTELPYLCLIKCDCPSSLSVAIQLLNGSRIYPLNQWTPSKLYKSFFVTKLLNQDREKLYVVTENSFWCLAHIGRCYWK